MPESTPRISLGEGYTPLIHARRLGRTMGTPLLHLKFEGANPTGSFKDRGMVMAVAKAIEDSATTLMCASTGNTAASAAAYGAASGLEVVVVTSYKLLYIERLPLLYLCCVLGNSPSRGSGKAPGLEPEWKVTLRYKSNNNWACEFQL
jgi:cysteine synthase